MRAHEILGSEVFASDGKKLGRVFDLEVTATGPLVNEIEGRAYELKALLVGPAAMLQRLGFHRTEMRGPLGLRFLASRLRGYKIPWDAVEEIEEHRLTLSTTKGGLARLDRG